MKITCLLLTLFLIPPIHALRLVSTSPAATEMIFDLEKGGALVGVSDYCHYPLEAKTKIKIGSALTPNYEKILAIKPDLILLQEVKNSPLKKRLKKLKIKSLELKFNTLEDVMESYQRMAVELKHPKKGQVFVNKVKKLLPSPPLL